MYEFGGYINFQSITPHYGPNFLHIGFLGLWYRDEVGAVGQETAGLKSLAARILKAAALSDETLRAFALRPHSSWSLLVTY